MQGISGFFPFATQGVKGEVWLGFRGFCYCGVRWVELLCTGISSWICRRGSAIEAGLPGVYSCFCCLNYCVVVLDLGFRYWFT